MARIVVIGASQGGVQALHGLLASLPADFPVPILVVQHIGATESILPAILSSAGPLRASFAIHGEPLTGSRIYVAPPDHHMLVDDGLIELTRGPRENWARPALDPLFRSAAQSYAEQAVGIVLTGRLNDGTSGLYEIKRRGGIAIVQTPREAEAPDMPQSALDNVAVDYCLPVREMPRLLIRLVGETLSSTSHPGGAPVMQQQLIIEPSAQTCPECGGAMREEKQGLLTRFRCHTGHVMTAEVLAAAQLEMLENNMATMLRTLNERAALCRDIAAGHEASGNAAAAQAWQRAAEEAEDREKQALALVAMDWTHPEAPRELEG